MRSVLINMRGFLLCWASAACSRLLRVSKWEGAVAVEVPSVANRTDDPRRISPDKGVRRNVLGDNRTRRDDRVLTHCYATNDGRAGCDPHVLLNHDGLADCGCASLRRFKGVARRDDAHVRADHHIVRDVEATK